MVDVHHTSIPLRHFAATVYDNKAKQRGDPGEYDGNFDYLL